MLKLMGCDTRAANEKGLETCWPDNQQHWSITLNGDMLIRGRMKAEVLKQEIHISMKHFEKDAYENSNKEVHEPLLTLLEIIGAK